MKRFIITITAFTLLIVSLVSRPSIVSEVSAPYEGCSVIFSNFCMSLNLKDKILLTQNVSDREGQVTLSNGKIINFYYGPEPDVFENDKHKSISDCSYRFFYCARFEDSKTSYIVLQKSRSDLYVVISASPDSFKDAQSISFISNIKWCNINFNKFSCEENFSSVFELLMKQPIKD